MLNEQMNNRKHCRRAAFSVLFLLLGTLSLSAQMLVGSYNIR